MNSPYYAEKLAAESLERCYALASPRVRQYLRAEIEFVVARLRPSDVVLDLGCGYGRTLPDFATATSFAVGIDTSEASLRLAQARLAGHPNILLACMDAGGMTFVEDSFDAVICVQNGIAAFGIELGKLVGEVQRVLRPGGTAMFSSYSDRFWDARLEWFEAQAAAGLIGPIDHELSGAGRIVCTDGLVLGAVGPDEFAHLGVGSDVDLQSVEVDDACWFHLVHKRPRE
jgi:2-polyprenyl-6-hydroxyphenyl methylase/3-demethylubiquinone-9 3-methyltransferase